MPVAKKEKKFKADFTKFYILIILPILVGIYLIYVGLYNFKLFPGNDITLTVFFCGIPFFMGAVIVFSIGMLIFKNRNKFIIITPQSLTFIDGKNKFTTVWKNLILTHPKSKKGFRQAIFSDGNNFGKLDSFFYPNFDLILEVVDAAKEGAREESFEI